MTESTSREHAVAAQQLTALQTSMGVPPPDAHLRQFFEVWLDTFIYNGRLDPRLRELTILRVMWRCDRAFEWGNHYRHARQAGVSREEVMAVRTATPQHDLHGSVGLVVRAADEIIDQGALSESTVTELRELFTDAAEFDEFVYLASGYRMFATVAASKREPYRGSHAPWPPDGFSPAGAAPRA